MYKTIAIYSRIKDLNEFEVFYANEVITRVLELDEVKHIRVTTLIPANQLDQTDEVSLLVETYYHSAEALQQVLVSEKGKEITQFFIYIQETGMAKIESFFGNESLFSNTLSE